MTTTVPAIYAFPEFSGVADAVADHVLAAQNSALYENVNKKINVISSSKSITNLQSSSSTSPAPPNTLRDDKKIKQQQLKKERDLANRRFRIAISGGSLISVLNEGLLKRAKEVEWGRWDVYFADERLVPFDSPDSNYGLAKRKLFDLIPEDQPKPTIYHINEELISDPQECADDYEKSLIKGFAAKDSVKLPMFDLLLLGCAPDGHIASLFPGQPTLREQYAWVVPVEDAPSGPSLRITLTVPVICHAHRVTFVVEGSTKAPVVKTIMERPDKGLPSSIVNEGAAGRVIWFVDTDALTDVDVTKKQYKFLVDRSSS